MTTNENLKPSVEFNNPILDKLNALEKGNNSMVNNLERIEECFQNASPENVQFCISQINEICSNDQWIKDKWRNFVSTLNIVLESMNRKTV